VSIVSTETDNGTAVSTERAVGSDRTRRMGRRVLERINPALRLQQLLLFGALLLIWEAVVRVGWLNPFWSSQPTRIAGRLWELVGTGAVIPHLWATLSATFMGFAIGLVSGVIAGALLGYFRRLADLFEPLVMGLYSLPRVALAPLLILYFGIGLSSKVALAVTLAFFLVLLNTQAGVRGADINLKNAAKTMGASEFFIVRRVVMPAAIPWIITGAQNALIFSLTAVVVGEMLVSTVGLGHLVTRASATYDTTSVFALLAIMGFVAVVLNNVLLIIERRAQRYSPGARR